MQFRPPFSIDPNARSRDQQGLDRINDTVEKAGNFWTEERYRRTEDQRRQALLDLQRGKDNREADVHSYEYGDPSAAPAGGQPGGYMQWMSPGQEGPNPQGSVDYAAGQQGPQPAGAVDHGAHLQNWLAMGKPALYDHPDYGGGSGANPLDDYMTNARRYGAKRMADSQAFEEKSADTALKRSTARYYDRRWSGPPGRGGGGSGSGSISGMTTRELTTYRNSIEKDLMYGVPGSQEYNGSLDQISEIDAELQNRLHNNRTPRLGSEPGSVKPAGNPGAGGGQGTPELDYLTKQFPNHKGGWKSADIEWARKKMTSGR